MALFNHRDQIECGIFRLAWASLVLKSGGDVTTGISRLQIANLGSLDLAVSCLDRGEVPSCYEKSGLAEVLLLFFGEDRSRFGSSFTQHEQMFSLLVVGAGVACCNRAPCRERPWHVSLCFADTVALDRLELFNLRNQGIDTLDALQPIVDKIDKALWRDAIDTRHLSNNRHLRVVEVSRDPNVRFINCNRELLSVRTHLKILLLQFLFNLFEILLINHLFKFKNYSHSD